MAVADYKCSVCGAMTEASTENGESFMDVCSSCSPQSDNNKVTFTRVWAFSIGRGTSGGTPPR